MDLMTNFIIWFTLSAAIMCLILRWLGPCWPERRAIIFAATPLPTLLLLLGLGLLIRDWNVDSGGREGRGAGFVSGQSFTVGALLLFCSGALLCKAAIKLFKLA